MCWSCPSPGDTRSDRGVLMATEGGSRTLYSHCPLKKRPVNVHHNLHLSNDTRVGEISRPENLSMKPDDLCLKRKIPTDPPVVTLSLNTSTLIQDRIRPKGTATLLRKYLQSSPLPPQKNHEIRRITLSDRLTLDKPPNSYSYDSPTSLRLFASQIPSHLSTCSPAKGKRNGFYALRVSSDESWLRFDCTRDSIPCDFKVQGSTLAGCLLSNHSPTSIVHDGSIRTPSPLSIPEDLSSPGSVASSGRGSTESNEKNKDEAKFNHYRYKCSLCLKQYSTVSGLRKHQKFRCTDIDFLTSKQFFSCSSCEKVYVSLGALKMHIRTHTLPCKCNICGKAFSRPWLLQGHIRTHTGEKPFCCPLCNRAFADRSNLRAHLQTHSEVKKYSCSSCGKTFSRMSMLTKHLSTGCPAPGLPPDDYNP